jgi:hypothetical protein
MIHASQIKTAFANMMRMAARDQGNLERLRRAADVPV